MKKFLLISIASTTFATSIHADRFYIGGFGGYTHLVKSEFIDKDTKSKISLSSSKMYGGKIGYEFAPNMFLEMCISNIPDAKLNVELKTKDQSDTSFIQRNYHLNLIYDLNPISDRVTPYFLFGLGISNVRLEKFDIKKGPIELFTSKEQSKYSKSWNAALGLNLALSNNVYIDTSCKFLSVQNVEVDYQKFGLEEKKMIDSKIITYLPNIQWNLGIKFKI